jgi:hypothetical protein
MRERVSKVEAGSAVLINGRLLMAKDRAVALKRGLRVRRTRLERSIEHVRKSGFGPRPADLERWARMQGEVKEFERLLAMLQAGEVLPESPRTGRYTGTMPDYIAPRAHKPLTWPEG